MSDNVADVASRLTVPQIAAGRAGSPRILGEAMMERPGAMKDRTIHYKAQGYGRMGGTMMWRLRRMGLADFSLGTRADWHPARAYLTPLGRQVVQHLRGSDRT